MNSNKEENKVKLLVGQKVYLKPVGNMARSSKEVREYEIKKVGRKYFEVWQNKNKYSVIKFHINNCVQVTNYTPNWKLYFSLQEILDEKEHLKLADEIRKSIGDYGFSKLSLEQLRKIKTVIDNG